MKKVKLQFPIIILLCIAIIIAFELTNNDDEKWSTPEPVEPVKLDINHKLPYTVQVQESDQTPDIIAYRIMFDFMKSLESEGTTDGASFTRFTKLSGDENSFVVAVVFNVYLPEREQIIDYEWGEAQENGVVPNIVWKLTINKVENLTYTLSNIERTSDTQIGLPPVDSLEEYRKNAGIEEPSDNIHYEIKDETLRVTYDNRQNWKVVPVEFTDLMLEGYSSNLVDGTCVITPKKTAFVLEEYAGYDSKLRVMISEDQGESWNDVLVSDQLPASRLLKIGFTSEQDGYLIYTGDKTMSSEAHIIFKTNDGGGSWYDVGSVDGTYRLVTDGGFIDDQLGFMSFGELRYESQPPVPHFYRTGDGGLNWERALIPIPEEYLGYFTIAEIPTFQGTEGTLLVKQGPDGDYLGGKVLAKFHSQDQGKTWSFAGLVDPDGVLRP